MKRLFVFDSVVRDDFNTDSDIDFAVDFEENDPLKKFSLKEKFVVHPTKVTLLLIIPK